ncbi:MAG: symmetrical bis(5'-nucleosyl)-tetraphosphatase [Porticoccaceae bacterium]|nr:symmetrical bis(5'-nucleosyl)-tetraphosphatase [Porticoccaceae bacterium]
MSNLWLQIDHHHLTSCDDRSASQKDTLDAILSAPDRHDLLEWLRHHPLLVRDGDNLIVHAGIPPQWDAGQARDYAGEVEAVLHSETPGRLFRSMYGNSPDSWHDDLTGDERLRVITNYLTRMRFCDAQGRLDLTHKQGPGNAPPGFAPWYAHSNRGTRDLTIVFGHWAALNGQVHQRGLHALDTGCVWGGRLRLMRLNDGKYWHTSCAPGGHLP